MMVYSKAIRRPCFAGHGWKVLPWKSKTIGSTLTSLAGVVLQAGPRFAQKLLQIPDQTSLGMNGL